MFNKTKHKGKKHFCRYCLQCFCSIQFMSSSLDLLIKNLSDNDFKYLSQKYCGNLLRLVKQKGVYIYDYMDNFRKFSDEKLPDRLNFFNSIKNECVSEKNY